MKLVLMALLAAVVLAAGALIAAQPAGAELPGMPCTADNRGTSTPRLSFDERRGVWVLVEFQCVHNSTLDRYRWSALTYPVASFGTDKPEGVHFTGRYKSNGFPEFRTSGSSPVASSPSSYWNVDVSRQIERGLSGLVYAGDICNALWDGKITGSRVSPAHVYRVGSSWHYIADQTDRAEYGRPDATMKSIWGTRTVFQDHDNNPATHLRGVEVTFVAECNR